MRELIYWLPKLTEMQNHKTRYMHKEELNLEELLRMRKQDNLGTIGDVLLMSFLLEMENQYGEQQDQI